jgi:hypothetical protein
VAVRGACPVSDACTRDDVRMKLMRRVVVFDAANLATESASWAGMLDGEVLPDDTWHSVFDAAGQWCSGWWTRTSTASTPSPR